MECFKDVIKPFIMKKFLNVIGLLILSVCAYSQDYSIKENSIIKTDEKGKVLNTKIYNKSSIIKDYANGNGFILVALNYDDYSKLEILNSELIFQSEKTINSSSNIKAIAINNKNEILILFSNGSIGKYDSKLNKIE
jgi:hypothetical protein